MTSPPRTVRLLLALAVAALGCGPSFRAARLSQSVSMSPMSDATISVEAGRVLVSDAIIGSGIDDDTAVAVELGVTNAGHQPYSLSAASISCWLELSPDRPGETLSLTPAGGGEGNFPDGLAVDDMQLGSTTIPPGESRHYWVAFRGYRFPGSDVPRRMTILIPDARGRRMKLVVADPANGGLRWEVKPARTGLMYGVQNTSLLASGLTVTSIAATIAEVSRAGPILWDAGLTSRLLVQQRGGLDSPTSSFMGTGVAGHVTWPFTGWGAWQDPRRFGVYAGGEAQFLIAIQPPPQSGQPATTPTTYGTLSAEGGFEFDIGALRPAATPFPISWDGPALPRWTFRVGYTHWFAGGLNSGGYTTSIRLAW